MFATFRRDVDKKKKKNSLARKEYTLSADRDEAFVWERVGLLLSFSANDLISMS